MESPAQYSKVKSLFLDASELRPEDVDAFLAEACGDDAELRAHVERLLAQDQGTDVELISKAKESTQLYDTPGQPASAEMAQIGGYRIVRKLGEGGMGTVFEAEQPNPKRMVALKVMRAGRFASEYSIKLFEREIQALARLKHPGIASIYEAGCTEDGHRFFTMELASGETLRGYVTQRKPAARQFLSLFLRICQAVTYAHQRGVIHRDLKPSNIMVQEEGGETEVKVLDFGLARIADDENGAEALSKVGFVQGTLPYMSPEQVSGNPDEIDLRTDVYALGVILYEALAGQLPHQLDNLSVTEAARIIQHDKPEPLQRVSKEKLDEDLCTIVHKALDKDPQRRYPSVSALSDDITRYIDNQPIQARPPSTIYQVKKLVARHKLGFGFATTVLFLIVASVVSISLQAQRIAKERDRANREAETSQQVSSFLTRSFSVANPTRAKGESITAREILDQGAKRIKTELKDQPEVRASLLLVIAESYDGLGLYPEARQLAEESLELRRKHYGAKAVEVSALLHELAMIQHNQGDLDASLNSDRESLEIRRALFPAASRQIAETLTNMGATLGSKSEYQQAVVVLQEALDIARKLEGDNGLRTVNAIQQLGFALLKARDYAKAEPLLREAITIYERRNESVSLASTYNDLGNLLGLKGDYAGADAAYRKCRDAAVKIFGPAHANISILDENIAVNMRRQGRLQESEALMRDSMGRFEKALGDKHPRYSVFLEGLADVLRDKGDLSRAEKLYRQGLEFDQTNPKAGKGHLAGSYARLGQFLTKTGRAQEGEPLLHKSLDMFQEISPSGSPEVAEYQRGFGLCLKNLNRFAEAETQLLLSYQMFQKTFGQKHFQTRDSAQALAALYQAWEKPEEAAKYLGSN